MEYFTNGGISTGIFYTFLFSRCFTGHFYHLERIAKHATWEESTETSSPDEGKSKAAHKTPLITVKAGTFRQKKSPHAKDMEALKISVKMKIFS